MNQEDQGLDISGSCHPTSLKATPPKQSLLTTHWVILYNSLSLCNTQFSSSVK